MHVTEQDVTLVVGGALAASALVALTLLAFATLSAGRVVRPRAPELISVADVAGGSIRFAAGERLPDRGTYAIWFGAAGHAVVGPPRHGGDGLARELLRTSGGFLAAADRVRWTTHVYRDAADVSADAVSVAVPTELGDAPAWWFPATHEARASTWAIHIHGLRTTRVSALRSVPAFRSAGTTSLVVSFRGDGEGPSLPGPRCARPASTRAAREEAASTLGARARGASALGTREWRDVDAAITFARSHGAQSIILVGWSLGATIAMLTLERSPARDLIDALVLIAPATNWRALIEHGVIRAGLPRFAARLTCGGLRNPWLSRASGLSHCIDVDALDWTSTPRLRVPTLVIHSPHDTEVPVDQSLRLASANPDTCTVRLIDSPGHAAEYNTDPRRFDEEILRWLDRRDGR